MSQKNNTVLIDVTKNDLIALIKSKYPTNDLIEIGVFKQYGYFHGLYGRKWYWINDELNKLSIDELKTFNDMLSDKYQFSYV